MKRIKYRDQFFYKYAIMSIVRHKKCLYNTLYIRYAGIVQRLMLNGNGSLRIHKIENTIK